VLAGSELRDLEPILEEMEHATGVKVDLNYSGSLEGAETIARGGSDVDVAWFSHSKYLSLLPAAAARIVAQEKIMFSPVILGVKQSVAQNFGWLNNSEISWRDIQEKAADGSFELALADPNTSNSGLSALVGVASAFSGSGDSIDTGSIDSAALVSFLDGAAISANSSGSLAADYVDEQPFLDGMINYESVLMTLDDEGRLDEPLTLVYPGEGTITADYPLVLLNAEKRRAYDKVVDYLRSPDVQARLMKETNRRPLDTTLRSEGGFAVDTVPELPFPSRLETISSLLGGYVDDARQPASTIFVLDTSGSMDGARFEALKTAVKQLTGVEPLDSPGFVRYDTTEDITLVTFSTSVDEVERFTLDDSNPGSAPMLEIRDYVDGLVAGGNSAMYTGLDRAFQQVGALQLNQPKTQFSIVLLTDGESNDGMSAQSFMYTYNALPDTTRDAAVYPIYLGDDTDDDVEYVAEVTDSRVYYPTPADLGEIFKNIRGVR